MTKPIFLNCYQNVAFYDEASLPKIDHNLGRRMTPLQRGTLFAGRCLFAKHQTIFEEFFADHRNVILFATAFGEVSANFSVIKDICENRLPVSPKDFQHSVYNAALGYLAIVEKVNLHMIAITSGYLSVDRALQLSALRLLSGTPKILVFCADEHLSEAATVVRAEVFLLSDRLLPLPGRQFHIDGITTGFPGQPPNPLEQQVFEQRHTTANPYCFLEPQFESETHSRVTVASTGEWAMSSWTGVTWSP